MAKNDMYYTLQDGTQIAVGQQNFTEGTVPVKEIKSGNVTDCPMYQEEDGDIGFTCKGEDVLFHWLKYQLN